MKTIDKQYTFTQIIKKSIFICNIIPIKSYEEAYENLSKIKKQYYDATHNCFSIILGEEIISARNSDDGEPSKTAGIPIYEVLNKNNITNVIAIVTRYFGGIKLGAGGLVRAYTSSVSSCLKIANIIQIKKTIEVLYEFNYIYLNEILKILKPYKEINSEFSANVKLTYQISLDDENAIEDKIITISKGNARITKIK